MSCAPLFRGPQSPVGTGMKSRPEEAGDSTPAEGMHLHASNELIGASVVARDASVAFNFDADCGRRVNAPIVPPPWAGEAACRLPASLESEDDAYRKFYT